MMQIIRHPADLPSRSPKACLAIGMFDGVHLGHQQVLRQAINDARQHHGISIAVTFDRHPNAVVAPHRVPPLIYPLAQKLRTLETLRLDATLLLEFTSQLSQKSPEDFVCDLLQEFGQVYSICVGNKFTFGHRRAGNVELLQSFGKKYNFEVHGLAAVSLDGRVISSTRIRESIASGAIDPASQMLGRPYSISSPVIHGDHLGRTLGFPTANLDVSGLALLPSGVYAACARLKGHLYKAAVNIGTRPTLRQSSPPLRVEAHLVDFNGDLYGADLELIFVQKLRPEKAFSSLSDLQQQIALDVAAARHALD